jgi:hypothetical protein
LYQPPSAAAPDPDAEAALVRTASGFRLRPLDLTDVLDEIFKIYRANFPVFAGVSVLLTLPQAVLNMVTGNVGIYGALIDQLKNPATATPYAPPDPGLMVFGSLILYLVTFLLSPFSVGAVVAGTCDHVMGRPVTWLSVIKACIARYGWLLLLSFILGLSIIPVACSFGLLVPVWIWVIVKLTMAPAAMFVERIGLFDAFSRSWRLTDSKWWRTFGILLLVTLLHSLLSYVLTWLTLGLAATALFLPGWVSAAIVFTAIYLASGLVLPIVQIAIVLLYFDLRVRKEGLDLQLLAQRTLSQPQVAAAPGA